MIRFRRTKRAAASRAQAVIPYFETEVRLDGGSDHEAALEKLLAGRQNSRGDAVVTSDRRWGYRVCVDGVQIGTLSSERTQDCALVDRALRGRSSGRLEFRLYDFRDSTVFEAGPGIATWLDVTAPPDVETPPGVAERG